jgi:hypothetical protein
MARTWGLTDWADWLSLYATGPSVFWGTLLVSSIYLAIAFGLPFLIEHTKKNTAVVVVPICVAFIIAVAVYGQHEISFDSDRHVTEAQRAKIKEIVGPVASTFPRALSVAAADNPESNAYAIELMIAFGLAGLKIESLNSATLIPRPMRALSPNVRGVFFEVHDPNNLPHEVQILRNALANAYITTVLYYTPQLGEDNYLLTVGLK